MAQEFDGYTIATIIVLAATLALPLVLFSWLSRRLCCDQQLRHFFAAQREELLDKAHERSGQVPSIRPPPRVLLSFRDVRYAVPISKDEDKHILRGVDAYFAPGTMTAIMGPSGCGKSTLLDVLADQKDYGTISGDIRINGHLRSPVFRRASAYVMQFDVLYPELTPRETLFFVTELRLGEDVSAEEKYQRVEQTLEDLDLTHVADTRIGDGDGGGGLSGGQKRRVTVAIELVTGPGLIMLDEPTSGLDAFGSLRLVKVLRGLADSGRTIACTIHQPRADIFRLFDKLLLMKLGIVMYFGSIDGIFPYFESLGIEVDYSVNPADFIVDLTKEKSEEEAEEERRVLERIALARERRKAEQASERAVLGDSQNDGETSLSFLASVDESEVSGLRSASDAGSKAGAGPSSESATPDENEDAALGGHGRSDDADAADDTPKETNNDAADAAKDTVRKSDEAPAEESETVAVPPGAMGRIEEETSSASQLQSSSQLSESEIPIEGLSDVETPRGGPQADIPIEGLSMMRSSTSEGESGTGAKAAAAPTSKTIGEPGAPSDSEMFKVEPVSKQPSLRGPMEVDLDMVCDAYLTSTVHKEALRTIYSVRKGIHPGLPPPLEESYGATEGQDGPAGQDKYASGFWKQVRTLARRAIVNDMRNSSYVFGNWVIGPIMMLFYGALYSNVDAPLSANVTNIQQRLDEMSACSLNDGSLGLYTPPVTVNTTLPSLENCGQEIAEDQQLAFVRASLIYQFLAAAYFSEGPYVAQVFLDKRMFFREHAARAYSSGAYHFAWYIRTFFAAFLKGLLFTPLGYFAAQLVPNAESYFLFAIFFGGMSACGSSMAVLCASLFPGLQIASSVFVFVNILAQNLCGYWLVKTFIPPWFIWIYYLNFFRYAFEGAVSGQQLPEATDVRARAWLYTLVVVLFAVGFQLIAFVATWLGNRTVSTDAAALCLTDPNKDEEFTDESFLANGRERQSELRGESVPAQGDGALMRGVSRRNMLDRYREAQRASTRLHGLNKYGSSVNTSLANNGGIIHY